MAPQHVFFCSCDEASLPLALGKISSLENAVNKIQANMESFNEKAKKMKETIQEIEAGLTFANKDIEEIKRRENQTSDKIKTWKTKFFTRRSTAGEKTYASSVSPKKVKVARIHVKWCTSFWRTN